MPAVTIYRNVYRIGGRDLSYVYDSSIYLVRVNDNDYVLIDVGTGRGLLNLIGNMLELSVSPYNIKYIILTHAHYHAAGSLWWFSRTKALSVAHEPDASFIRSGDRVYTGANEFEDSFTSAPISISIGYSVREYKITINDFTIRIFHTPGHTKGSISILIEHKQNNDNILFVGDSLSGILSSKWLSSETDFKETIREIHQIINENNIKILCTSIECYRENNIEKFLEYVMNKKPLWV